jgi:hypothetical protein
MKLNRLKFYGLFNLYQTGWDEYRVALYKFRTFYVELYYHVEHNALKKLKTISIEELSSAYPGLNYIISSLYLAL